MSEVKNNFKNAVKNHLEKTEAISAYHANYHAFTLQPSLRPTLKTAPLAEEFFKKKIWPDLLKVKNRKKDKEKLSEFLSLIGSLWFASNIKPLRISLNQNSYTKGKNKYFTSIIIEMFHWLLDNGYLTTLPGYYFDNEKQKKTPKKGEQAKKKQGRQTRIAPTLKLHTELLNDLAVISDPERVHRKDFLHYKDKMRKRRWYRDSQQTEKIITDIHNINMCNSKHRVMLQRGRKHRTLITDLHRVYNLKSFDCNGRYYTGPLGYQNLPKEERADILIDGNPTVELDFSGLHPRLLYAMKGIQYDNDPYSAIIADEELRSVLKLLLLTLLNAETMSDAVYVVKDEILEKSEDECFRERLFAHEVLPEDEVKNLKRKFLSAEGFSGVRELANKFKEVHAPIADFFFKNMGYRLMNVDSRIATEVLLHFADKGEACLSVHDSFIVEARLEEELRQIMASSYSKVAQEISPDSGKYTCIINKK